LSQPSQVKKQALAVSLIRDFIRAVLNQISHQDGARSMTHVDSPVIIIVLVVLMSSC